MILRWTVTMLRAKMLLFWKLMAAARLAWAI